MASPPLLIFGIDSATLTLVAPWIEQGELPTLGRLARTGAVGRLWSVPNMITPPAWTTFATGCNPGKHGIFYFTERVGGSYEERFIKGAARTMPPFWMLLSEAGVRTTVLNVPMTYPADPVAGLMVSGMDAPGVEASGFTHPPELGNELLARFGELVGPGSLSGAIGHLMLAGRYDAALEVLERRVELRTALARYLLERTPVDVFALVHTEVDGVQHYFWRFIDPRVPGYSARAALRYGNAILRLYRKVDRSLHELMQAMGEPRVIVMSDHGAGASPGPEDGVPWIRLVLEEMGLAVPRVERNGLARAGRRTVAAAYRALNPRLPGPLRRTLRRAFPGARRVAKRSVKYQYDWSRTRAFCLGAAGDVWLNVRGRDPDGVVEAGAEYERLRTFIRDTFLTLRDAVTGERVVEGVFYREEVYHGPFVERAPDLIIRFSDTVVRGVIVRGKTLRLPRRQASRPKEVKSGSHRPDGLVIFSGAGVASGAVLNDAHLEDIAPTILYWMDQPVPTYMDGRVLSEAFTPEHRATLPLRAVERYVHSVPREAGYSPEETAVVLERLRGLGYV